MTEEVALGEASTGGDEDVSAPVPTESRPTKGKKRRRKSLAERLESGERILSLIEKAETKRVAKKKIIHFLKRKGVSEPKIIEAYQAFYKKERLYEITFTERPLGFSVIMDTRGSNAIVSSIQSGQNEELGLKVASRMYEVNGKRVDGMKHKQILSIISGCKCPFFVVFKDSKTKRKKKQKKLKKLTKALHAVGEGGVDAAAVATWQEDDDTKDSDDSDYDSEEEDLSEESEHSSSDCSSESESSSSGYSSSDDEAHLAQHLQRKLVHEERKRERMERRARKKKASDPGVFKPDEINEWDAEVLEEEQSEMMKELAKLMILGAMTQTETAGSPQMAGMTQKRAKTFERMVVAATPKAGDAGVGDATDTPPVDSDSSRQMSFSVTDLMAFEEDEASYDHEIFGYLTSLTGDDLAQTAMSQQRTQGAAAAGPGAGGGYFGHATTPSMSAALGAMWTSDLYEEETVPAMDLPPGAFGAVGGVFSAEAEAAVGGGGDGHSADAPVEIGPVPLPPVTAGDYFGVAIAGAVEEAADAGAAEDGGLGDEHGDDASESSSEEKEETGGGVLDTMKGGTTFMKYGRFGRPKYRMFQLSKDHRYLLWFSPKKDQSDTKIPVKYIQAIRIGKESDAASKTKSEEVQETSFTVVYGKDARRTQSLTVTAKNEKEAFVWAQGLKMLADHSRKGRDVSKITSLEAADDGGGDGPRLRRTQSVVIDMDRMRSSTVMSLFHKSDKATVVALRKKHGQLKAQLQKCVDFVMTKSNYKVVKEKGEFENVKAVLERIDVRLREIKELLSSGADPRLVSSVKSEMFSIHADLDALRHKLTVLVRKQRKL